MMELRPVTDPAPGLEWAMLSERIVNYGVPSRIATPEAKAVFAKAVSFLDRARRGEETSRTLKLGVTSAADLPAYELGLKAYNELPEAHQQAMLAFLQRLIDVCQLIANGKPAKVAKVSENELAVVRRFFKLIKDVTDLERLPGPDHVLVRTAI